MASRTSEPKPQKCPWCLQPPAKIVGHPVRIYCSAGGRIFLQDRDAPLNAPDLMEFYPPDWKGPTVERGTRLDCVIVAAPKPAKPKRRKESSRMATVNRKLREYKAGKR